MTDRFTLHVDGKSYSASAKFVLPGLPDTLVVPKTAAWSVTIPLNMNTEQRRNLMVFWLMLSALAEAKRILD